MDEEMPSDEIGRKIQNIILSKDQRVSPSFNRETAQRELNEKEKLKFYCDNCGHTWMKIRPDGYCIRYGDNTNFFVHMENENEDDGIRTYIYCPKCNKSKKIRRLAAVKPSPRFHGYQSRKIEELLDDPFLEP